MSKRDFHSLFSDDLNQMIDLKVAEGGTESTYLSLAHNFDAFCVTEHPDASILTQALELDWLKPVMDSAPQVIHVRICFLNGFATYLNNMGKEAHVLHNRFASGRTVFVPYLFTDEELTNLFHVIDTDESTTDPFQRIMLSVYFRMIYTCGLRPQEGRNLKKHNVNLNSGEVLIECSKKRKSRIVVMSDEMKALASRYATLLQIAYPKT